MTSTRVNWQVNVHPDVRRGAKVYAAQHGMTLGELTAAALLAYGVAPVAPPAAEAPAERAS